MKKLLILILACIGLAACGAKDTDTGTQGGATSSTKAAAGPSKLSVKVDGKDSTLEVKSSTADFNTFGVTPPGGQTTPVTLQSIILANYEMDVSPHKWSKPLTEPGQMRVSLALMNGDGGRELKFKVGTYSAQTDGSTGIYEVVINTFADGKPKETRFYGKYMGSYKSDNPPTGEVKITSVTAETVSGEVNLTERDTQIKGAFTAKLPPPRE